MKLASSLTPSAGTPRNAPKNQQQQKPEGVRPPGARKEHPHLPRFACADRLRRLRCAPGGNPPLALAAPAGVGQGQGVSVKRHGQTIQKLNRME